MVETETRDFRGKSVTVVLSPMTKEEARQEFPYRPHTKYSESRFGGNELMDDAALILNSFATRCGMCRAPTINEYLMDSYCPDCDGRSEGNGKDPREN